MHRGKGIRYPLDSLLGGRENNTGGSRDAHKELRSGTYQISGYYSFKVYEPKERTIHALHYRDRVVQHCLCDEIITPLFERYLIYDNAACRKGKGTLFAINRLSGFLRSHYRRHGNNGYFLKCDIRKFFDNIDHEVLKGIIRRVIRDNRVFEICCSIIDSYETLSGKGLPLGNQTSQWFALIYLDGLDRLCKEKLQLKYYTRYMDDIIIVHADKEHLHSCVAQMSAYIEERLNLKFNEKTQIFPMKNGVEYLGFRFTVTKTGKINKRLKKSSKLRYLRSLKLLRKEYGFGRMRFDDIRQKLSGYHGHMVYGSTYALKRKALSCFNLVCFVDVTQAASNIYK